MDQSDGNEQSEIEQIIDERTEEVGDIGDPEKWRDFNDAYEKLVEKITQNNDPQMLDMLYNPEEYNEM